jgi:hypothetical protein
VLPRRHRLFPAAGAAAGAIAPHVGGLVVGKPRMEEVGCEARRPLRSSLLPLPICACLSYLSRLPF